MGMTDKCEITNPSPSPQLNLAFKSMHEMTKIPKRVISFEIQIGITSQRSKWANTNPRTYRRCDQVPRRSKHPMSTGQTRCESSFMIMNADLSAVKVSVPCRCNYWYGKCQTIWLNGSL
jgi:hypothetical protein